MLFFGCVAIGQVETAEILRVLGPFPNVRNTLAGKWCANAEGTPGLTFR
jgi:hypothetical protein